jgi:hypothetical protein
MSSSESNTDRLFDARFFVGDRSDVPAVFERFLETLSKKEVACLISVKEKLDAEGIAIGPPPELADKMVVYMGGGVL